MSRALALLLLVALPGCGGSVDVSYRRPEGVKRTYLRTEEVEGTNPVSGIKARVRQEVTTTETPVEVVRGESTTVQVTLDRLTLALYHDGPDPVLSLDTAKEEAVKETGREPATEEERFLYRTMPFRFLAGCKAEVDVRPSGKILKVAGVEELRGKVLARFAADDPRREIVGKFPWEFWIANLTTPAVCVPERGTTVGADAKFLDVRTLPDTTGAGGFMYYAGTFRLAKVEEGVARMEMSGEVFLDPPSPELPPWPRVMASRRNLLRLDKGTCKAWARIRVDTGVLEEDEHVTDLDLFFVRPGGKGEVAIPTKVTRTTRLVK